MKDLSSLANGSLTWGSMNASNQLTEPQPFSGQMTAQTSEPTERAPLGHLGIDPAPEIPVGSPKDRQGPGSFTPTPRTWKETVNNG